MSKQFAQIMLDMFLPLLVGYFLRRVHKNFTSIFDVLVRLNITAIFPLLSALSLWAIRFDARFVWLPFLGVLQQLIPGFIGYLFGHKRMSSLEGEGSFVISSLLSNRAMMGTLSVFILLGDQPYAMSQLVVFLEPVVTFAGAFPWAGNYQQRLLHLEVMRFRLRSLLNRNMLPLLGMMAGILLHFSGYSRPDSLTLLFPYLIHLNAWSVLLPVGYSIHLSGIKRHLKPIGALAAIKFVVTPLATLLLLVPFWGQTEMVKVLMALSFAPTAVFAVLAAKIYQLDIDLSVASFVVTTILYLVLIFPLLAAVLHALNGNVLAF